MTNDVKGECICMQLSIIIPVYNEASRGIGTSKSLTNRLYDLQHDLQLPFDYEVIIVDDGSKDDTYNVCNKYIKDNDLSNWHIYRLKWNRGKGRTLMHGLSLSHGEYVTYIDADLSISPGFLSDFFAKYGLSQSICYVGNRYLKSSIMMNNRSMTRKMISSLSQFMIRLFTSIRVGDTQCGFKVFHLETYKSFARYLAGYSWLFDIELLYALKCKNVTLLSVPVIWDNMESESTLNALQAIKRSMQDFLHFIMSKHKIKSQIKLTI